MTLSVTNTSSSALFLNKLHLRAKQNSDPKFFDVKYDSGDLAEVANGTSVTNLTLPTDATYHGYEVSLSGLSDSDLEPGESATFSFYTYDVAGPYTYIDNLAISGDITSRGTVVSIQ